MMAGGFFSTKANAQSCCAVKKECKPAVCCPITPNCCKATKSIENSTAIKCNVAASQPNGSAQPSHPKQPIKKEENLLPERKLN